MCKFVVSMFLTLLSLNAFAAEKLPTCDEVFIAVDKGAKQEGLQFAGAQAVPIGQFFAWESQKLVYVLAFLSEAPKDTKLFIPKGECTAPDGRVGQIWVAEIVKPSEPT